MAEQEAMTNPSAFNIHVNTHASRMSRGRLYPSAVRVGYVERPNSDAYEDPAMRGFHSYRSKNQDIRVLVVRGPNSDVDGEYEQNEFHHDFLALPSITDSPESTLRDYYHNRRQNELTLTFWDTSKALGLLSVCQELEAITTRSSEKLDFKQRAVLTYLPIALRNILEIGVGSPLIKAA